MTDENIAPAICIACKEERSPVHFCKCQRLTFPATLEDVRVILEGQNNIEKKIDRILEISEGQINQPTAL